MSNHPKYTTAERSNSVNYAVEQLLLAVANDVKAQLAVKLIDAGLKTADVAKLIGKNPKTFSEFMSTRKAGDTQ